MSNLTIEFAPSNNLGSPKRRNVRRRLVQSTLLPHKPQEPDDKADKKDETDFRQDGRGEEELRTSEGKKRKSRGKATTPSEGSKRDKTRRNNTPKRHSSPRKTPRKNALANMLKGSTSRQLLDDFSQTDPVPVPDLRLEAKLSSEESSRIFSGRQIHPFFSLWKAAKKPQGTAESEDSLCASESKDEPITCGPIHVYEKTQDDAVPLDWKKWTFLGEVASVNRALDFSIPLVLGGSVETINFDRLISNLKLSSASSPQNAAPCSDGASIEPRNLQEISATNSSVLAEEGTICFQILENAKVDLEIDKADTSSGQAGIPGKSDAMPRSRFLEESMRSYYHSNDNKAEGSLWTYKYKPTKAIEVCGNDESVNSMSDWLHQWHERCYRSKKDSSISNKDDFPDKDDDDDDDYDCSYSDYDSDDINDKDSLQNVLLITGPVGSGKSAAVYACAQEQGFDILELNASDCRNGTAVKHYFGDTLGSHRFKSSLEHTGVPHKRKNMKLPLAPVLPICKQADKLNDGAVEVISISDDEAHNPGGSSQRLPSKENGFRCGDKAHTLILVEDVDILFPEDRGCIAAIQQIAETAKGPIILTSNSNNPVLPDNLDRLHVGFSLPSRKELLCHLHMVCVTEGVNVHPVLLEKFIQACDGDMRKTIMHLQFWLHSEKFSKDRIVQTFYGSLPFDLEAVHQILPKIIRWTFPSQLSELIEEVSKSVNIMEENSSLQKSIQELGIIEMQNKLDILHEGTDYIEAKKRELLKRNGSATGCCEFETQFSDIYEFSNSPGISDSFSEWNVRRKLVVMSSDSEDEALNNGDLLDKCNATNKAVHLTVNNEFHSEFPLNQNCSSPSLHGLVCSGLEDSEEEDHKIPPIADDTCLNETCQSFDISFVPESSFVPETVTSSGIETMSGAVSSGHASGPLEVSINNQLTPFSFNACKSIIARSLQNFDLLGKAEIPESSEKEAANDFLHENMEINVVYNVMDECSRVDFHQKSEFVKSCLSKETDVQKLWRTLRDCRTDLRQLAALEQQGAPQVVKLAYGLSNLISEADLLFHYHKRGCGISEPPDFLSDEATFSWYDEQMMMTTVASHGFCFYAKHIADVRSKLGCEGKVELMSEMLTSKTNTMALGKLSIQDLTNCTNIYAGMELEINKPRNDLPRSEIKTSLLDVFQSIVPARLFLALRGAASYEYISTMRQISRSEAVRLSQGTENTRLRGRGALHYLSRGNMMLSSEDISLLCEGDLYRKISFEAENKLR